MLGTVAGTLLLLAIPAGGPDPEVPPADDHLLRATHGGINGLITEFTSAWVDQGIQRGIIVTDTMTNAHTGAGFTYAFQTGDKGCLPKGEKKGGTVMPQSMTAVRTTHRLVEEITDYVKSSSDEEELDFTATVTRWREVGGRGAAAPGRGLEAKLVEGDEKGKVLVRCASEVTGDPEKGYTCTYTVENHTAKPIRFKWAGLEGTVEAKKVFTKSEPSKGRPREESGLAKFDFGDKKEFAILANLFARPK